MKTPMKIAILGAGSLGCVMGARLAEAGHPVTLINRNRVHVDAINTHGLRLRDAQGLRTVRVPAVTQAAGLGPQDLVVVLVKSFHTREAMASAGALLGPATVVVSLQNGLGHEDILADFVDRAQVIAGKTWVGGALLEPGLTIDGAQGKQTVIGELDGRITPRVQAIAQAFGQAGLATRVSDHITGTIWDKLLVNVATGALSAITRLSYGPLYRQPDLEATGVAAVQEAMQVASALGVRLSTTDPRAPWLNAGGGLPEDFKASMLQSLDKGSATEIDFVNGAVVRHGQACGVPTPVNRTLVACVKGIEAGMGLG